MKRVLSYVWLRSRWKSPTLAECRAELELQLDIRRLEIDADKQIKLRELELRVARDVPGPPVPIAPSPLYCSCAIV